jgi:hypothetical protein
MVDDDLTANRSIHRREGACTRERERERERVTIVGADGSTPPLVPSMVRDVPLLLWRKVESERDRGVGRWTAGMAEWMSRAANMAP